MAPTFTSPWSSASTEGKVRASTLGILREPGRNFCRQLMPLLPLKTQLLSPLRPPGTLASQLCCSSLPPLPWSAASLLEPPLTRPRQLPGAKTPVNFLPSVCVTQTLLCILETTHSRHKDAQSVGLTADAHQGRSARAPPRFLRTLERSRLIATSAHSEEMKRERQVAASRL